VLGPLELAFKLLLSGHGGKTIHLGLFRQNIICSKNELLVML